MTRRLSLLVFGPALVLLLLAGAFAWLLQTESGATWLWNRVTGAVPGLAAGHVRGDLRSGLTVTGLEYAGDGTEVRLDRAELRLALSLVPLAVEVKSLDAGRLEIRPADGGSEQPAAPAQTLASLALPVPVRISGARLAEFTILGPDGEPAATISDLAVAGDWHDAIELRRLELKYGDDAALDGSAELGLRPPFPLEANLRARLVGEIGAALAPRGGDAQDAAAGEDPEMAAKDAASGVAFEARLAGDLQALGIEASARHTTMLLQGSLVDLLTEPGWELELEAARLPLGTAADAPAARNLSLSSFGRLDDYRVEAAGGLVLPGQPPVQLTISGGGDQQGLDVEFAQAVHPAGNLTAEGRVGWVDGATVSASATIERLDPAAWIDDWPADHPLAGSLSLAWSAGELGIPEFRLAAAQTSFAAHGSVTWSMADDRVTGELGWEHLEWPPASADPAFTSRAGELTLSGRPEDWRAGGRMSLQAAGLPEGELVLRAAGDLEAARIEVERGSLLGGTFEGTLDYRWAGAPAWSAEVIAQDLRTAPLLPAYPGILGGRVSVAAQPAARRYDITIESVDGTLRGRSVHADGRLTIDGGVPLAEDLRLRAGQSGIMLDGNPRQPEGLEFRADVASLADFVDEATGRLQAEGRLALAGAVPRLDLRADGADLAWQDWRAGSLSIRPQQLPGASSAHRMTVGDAAFAGYAVSELELSVGGAEPLQQVRVNASIDGTRMTVLLEGGVQDWQRPLASGWQGRIEEFRAEHDTLGFLELQEPAVLRASGSALELARACFLGTRGGEACVQADWARRGDLLLTAAFDEISLDVLRLLATTEVAFSHRLTGSAEWRVPGAEAGPGYATAKVRMQVSPGEVVLPNEEASVLRTGAGRFGFEIQGGKLTAGELDLPVVDAGTIETDFSVPDLSLGADAPVQARIRIELTDVGPLLSMVPHLDVVDGRASADLRVTGTVSDPDFTGHATLVSGRLENYATGLVLSDIRLAGAVYENDTTELNGTFRAGEGTGRIKATVGFADMMRPDVSLELTGTSLTLVDIPDLGLTADPDLRLGWRDGTVRLDGRVVVSEARLSPRYLPTETVTESPDVVIVAGPGAEAAEPAAKASELKLDGRVELVLGEDVTVTLENAEVEVGGKVTFIWEEQLVPTADGTLTLNGEIRAYGQLLTITEGRIRFPRRAATNPTLDIEAEREIYGNPRIRTAGVHVTGPLERPTIEPYTDPLTTQERAVTLLVTGRDFDYEQGTGGIAVGMYVAPRLYLSYGLGLFGDENVITARYDLKGGLGIRATSGQRETGVDISYTIED